MSDVDLDICIKCSAVALDEHSEFCYNCGYLLNSNYCSNTTSCDFNNGQQVKQPEYACFCTSCGSETTYFQEGLIKPSENPQAEHNSR